MNRQNYLKLAFPSYAGNEGFARTAVTSFVSRLDPTLEEMREIRTAVSEAVSNCITHAYPNEIGVITLCCRILEDNVITGKRGIILHAGHRQSNVAESIRGK